MAKVIATIFAILLAAIVIIILFAFKPGRRSIAINAEEQPSAPVVDARRSTVEPRLQGAAPKNAHEPIKSSTAESLTVSQIAHQTIVSEARKLEDSGQDSSQETVSTHNALLGFTDGARTHSGSGWGPITCYRKGCIVFASYADLAFYDANHDQILAEARSSWDGALMVSGPDQSTDGRVNMAVVFFAKKGGAQ